MKQKWMIGLLTGCLIVGAAVSRVQEISYEDTRIQTLELHRSLIGYATTEVRAGITASAQAAKDYLAACGKKCDLGLFLTNDLKERFPGLTEKALQLLTALVFAETVGDNTKLEKIDLNVIMLQQRQLVKMISNIMKNTHDNFVSIIRNLRA